MGRVEHPETLIGLPGYVLGCSDARGEALYATRAYESGETVMAGLLQPESRSEGPRQKLASGRFVIHGHLGKVRHSANPNCRFRVNQIGTYDVVARRNIPVGAEITFDHLQQVGTESRRVRTRAEIA